MIACNTTLCQQTGRVLVSVAGAPVPALIPLLPARVASPRVCAAIGSGDMCGPHYSSLSTLSSAEQMPKQSYEVYTPICVTDGPSQRHDSLHPGHRSRRPQTAVVQRSGRVVTFRVSSHSMWNLKQPIHEASANAHSSGVEQDKAQRLVRTGPDNPRALRLEG